MSVRTLGSTVAAGFALPEIAFQMLHGAGWQWSTYGRSGGAASACVAAAAAAFFSFFVLPLPTPL
eukprot:10740910-Heterocapsa_arctica.AAC.1